jgi:L-fuconolactonase
VRGIRRIMEFDKDPRALTLSDGFIEGVNLLEAYGWTFDINPNHTQMDIIRAFVPRISSGVPMILDHCGKPGIKEGKIEQFRDDMRDLARYPNMYVKLSDLPPYASKDWTEDELRPYIAATLEFFGPDRTIYAGDYPILLSATTLPQWVEVLDNAFSDLGLSETETFKIYRGNANAFYRLGL